MHPVLLTFQVGAAQVVLGSYSTFYVVAWVVALALGTVVAWRRGLPWWRALVYYLVVLVIGIAGARLLDVATDWGAYRDDPSLAYALGFRGFSLYGGLVVAVVAGIVLARPFNLPLWRVADSAVPAVAVGIVLMRTGCFLNGCCFGTATSLPWGVTFPSGSPAWAYQAATGESGILGFAGFVLPVHPTQIYEMMAAVMFGGVAMCLMLRRRRAPLGGGAPPRRAAAGPPAPPPLPGTPGRAAMAEGIPPIAPAPSAAASIRKTGAAVPAGVPFLIFILAFTLFRLGEYYLRPLPLTATGPAWFYPVLYALIVAGVAGTIVWRRGVAHRPVADLAAAER
jgi:phosphatidylglycerol---prolipoprotein diacylglyceryl transferase